MDGHHVFHSLASFLHASLAVVPHTGSHSTPLLKCHT